MPLTQSPSHFLACWLQGALMGAMCVANLGAAEATTRTSAPAVTSGARILGELLDRGGLRIGTQEDSALKSFALRVRLTTAAARGGARTTIELLASRLADRSALIIWSGDANLPYAYVTDNLAIVPDANRPGVILVSRREGLRPTLYWKHLEQEGRSQFAAGLAVGGTTPTMDIDFGSLLTSLGAGLRELGVDDESKTLTLTGPDRIMRLRYTEGAGFAVRELQIRLSDGSSIGGVVTPGQPPVNLVDVDWTRVENLGLPWREADDNELADFPLLPPQGYAADPRTRAVAERLRKLFPVTTRSESVPER